MVDAIMSVVLMLSVFLPAPARPSRVEQGPPPVERTVPAPPVPAPPAEVPPVAPAD